MDRLGINLLVWSGQLGPAEMALFPAIRAMGYHGVELPIFSPESLDLAGLKSALSDSGLACTVSTALPPDASLIDGPRQPAAIAFLQSVLSCAETLGAAVVCGPLNLPVGELRGRAYNGEEWRTCISGLREVGRRAADLGVTLAAEPLNRFETFIINTVADGVRMMDEVDNPHVGLLLDTFHMHIEEKSTADAIRAAAGHVKHFHCSENDRGIVGSGQIDWLATFQSLNQIDYSGWLVVESFNAVIPELAGATCIWREFADSPETLAQESLTFLQSQLL